MAERVLVTGGAGFVGLHLVRRLLHAGAQVTVLDDFSRHRPDAELREVERHVRVVRHDLTTPLPAEPLRGGFDAVYHLAAVVGVARTTADPAHVLRTNIQATENLLRSLDADPPGAFFLSSTSEVADGAAQLELTGYPTPESAPFVLAQPRSPRSSYALSKAVAEAMVFHRADRMRVRIGRYYNVYGPRMGSAHVIPQFIERILAREDPFSIHGADQSRAFCHVEDAVAATVALMRRDDPQPLLVNIGNDREEVVIRDLARRLLDVAGFRPKLRILPPPAGSPERRLPDLTVLRGLVRLPEPVGLDAGLAGTLDWYAAASASPADRAAVAT